MAEEEDKSKEQQEYENLSPELKEKFNRIFAALRPSKSEASASEMIIKDRLVREARVQSQNDPGEPSDAAPGDITAAVGHARQLAAKHDYDFDKDFGKEVGRLLVEEFASDVRFHSITDKGAEIAKHEKKVQTIEQAFKDIFALGHLSPQEIERAQKLIRQIEQYNRASDYSEQQRKNEKEREGKLAGILQTAVDVALPGPPLKTPDVAAPEQQPIHDKLPPGR